MYLVQNNKQTKKMMELPRRVKMINIRIVLQAVNIELDQLITKEKQEHNLGKNLKWVFSVGYRKG